jgi:hypothetical protein
MREERKRQDKADLVGELGQARAQSLGVALQLCLLRLGPPLRLLRRRHRLLPPL